MERKLCKVGTVLRTVVQPLLAVREVVRVGEVEARG